MANIADNLNEWAEQFKQGWLNHYNSHNDIDWSLYNMFVNKTTIDSEPIELKTSKLMLITSSGVYNPKNDAPFDAANPVGDYTIREISADSSPQDLDYAHDHYDNSPVKEDMQVLLPLNHLKEMTEAGEIGCLSKNVVSFMGYQPDVEKVVKETIPEIISIAKRDNIEAALLVPS